MSNIHFELFKFMNEHGDKTQDVRKSVMPDREKVIKGLEIHADGCGYRSHHCDAMECPYRYGDESCDIEEMCRDALALLKEQQARIDVLESLRRIEQEGR